jgi:hypothetical protein
MQLHTVPLDAFPDATPQHDALSSRPITAATMALHAPDTHLLAVRDGVAVARASLWWRDLPVHPDGRLGYVGHYAAADEAASTALLDHGARVLTDHGCALAVGPIDGTTWRSYRLVTERGDRPPFFLEPQNPSEWPGHFRAAGFAELAHYTSALVEDIAPESAKITAAAERLESAGYRFRGLDVGAVDRELHGLFEVSLAAFAGNFPTRRSAKSSSRRSTRRSSRRSTRGWCFSPSTTAGSPATSSRCPICSKWPAPAGPTR